MVTACARAASRAVQAAHTHNQSPDEAASERTSGRGPESRGVSGSESTVLLLDRPCSMSRRGPLYSRVALLPVRPATAGNSVDQANGKLSCVSAVLARRVHCAALGQALLEVQTRPTILQRCAAACAPCNLKV